VADLSPAAQAVLNAANNAQSYHPDDCLNESRAVAAAALQAAADQCKIDWNYHPDYPITESVIVVSDLLAIAADLEGQND
jgi:hypothetical protein